MPNAIGLQLSKKALKPLGIQVLHPLPAVGRDDLRKDRVFREESRHEGTPSSFQKPQHFHLGFKSQGSIGTMVGLDHPAIKAQMDRGP